MVVEELRVVGEQGMTSSSRWHRSRNVIRSKEAAGREKDRVVLLSLREVLERTETRRRRGSGFDADSLVAQARDLAESLQRRGVSTRDSRGKPADEVVFRVEGKPGHFGAHTWLPHFGQFDKRPCRQAKHRLD